MDIVLEGAAQAINTSYHFHKPQQLPAELDMPNGAKVALTAWG